MAARKTKLTDWIVTTTGSQAGADPTVCIWGVSRNVYVENILLEDQN